LPRAATVSLSVTLWLYTLCMVISVGLSLKMDRFISSMFQNVLQRSLDCPIPGRVPLLCFALQICLLMNYGLTYRIVSRVLLQRLSRYNTCSYTRSLLLDTEKNMTENVTLRAIHSHDAIVSTCVVICHGGSQCMVVGQRVECTQRPSWPSGGDVVQNAN